MRPLLALLLALFAASAAASEVDAVDVVKVAEAEAAYIAPYLTVLKCELEQAKGADIACPPLPSAPPFPCFRPYLCPWAAMLRSGALLGAKVQVLCIWANA